MADPRLGLPGKAAFFSLAGARAWIEDNTPEGPWKPLTALPEPEPTPEEREARYNRLKQVAQVLRDTVKAKVVGRPMRPVQINDHDKRMAALANLEAISPQADTDDR
jgi:hypothetical protein